MNFTDKDGDIAILFDVNIENGSCKSVWSHIKIDSNGQTIIRFYIDATNGKPGYIIYRDKGYIKTHRNYPLTHFILTQGHSDRHQSNFLLRRMLQFATQALLNLLHPPQT